VSEKNGNGHPSGDPRIRPDALQRDVLNIEEAAELLGVSIKTFNKVLHSEEMPARKIGREWKFSRKALIDWVGAGRSSQFYRENGEEEDDVTPPAAEPEKNETKRSRRTAGWQIELD
jgi:excisionase family DNA binding protein